MRRRKKKWATPQTTGARCLARGGARGTTGVRLRWWGCGLRAGDTLKDKRTAAHARTGRSASRSMRRAGRSWGVRLVLVLVLVLLRRWTRRQRCRNKQISITPPPLVEKRNPPQSPRKTHTPHPHPRPSAHARRLSAPRLSASAGGSGAGIGIGSGRRRR
ncbi:hypothetical protein B0H12DRAFT_1113384 [Mycena haematopus]|nr:hypothetical protein B0H12DRAFT_1113384 [Mycena haematopus]